MKPELEEVLIRLWDEEAVKIDLSPGGGFKLKSGILSPFYLNLRVPENGGALSEESVTGIGTLMHRYADITKIEFDGIAGIPRAGEPFAKAFWEADARRHPLLTLRKEGEGITRRIAGVSDRGGLPSGSHILLIDDLATRRDTKLEAVHAIRNADFRVAAVLVLVDRGQGRAGADLRKEGVEYYSLLPVKELFRLYQELRYMDDEELEEIFAFLDSQK